MKLRATETFRQEKLDSRIRILADQIDDALKS
jgi:hypothetical protein